MTEHYIKQNYWAYSACGKRWDTRVKGGPDNMLRLHKKICKICKDIPTDSFPEQTFNITGDKHNERQLSHAITNGIMVNNGGIDIGVKYE